MGPRKAVYLARVSVCLALVIVGVACRPESADDDFARQFIEHVRTGADVGASLREPGSKISDSSWSYFVGQFARHFPGGHLDTIQLVEWERGGDDEGQYRKLTYALKGSTQEVQAEVWLVTKEGRRYVNTFRVTGGVDPQE
jgi:hypothetical protein